MDENFWVISSDSEGPHPNSFKLEGKRFSNDWSNCILWRMSNYCGRKKIYKNEEMKRKIKMIIKSKLNF